MKSPFFAKTLLVAGIAALSFSAFADNNHGNPGKGHGADDRSAHIIRVNHDTYEHHPDRHPANNRNDHRDQPGNHYGHDIAPRGAFKTGYILPSQYRGAGYQFARYRTVGLQRPGKNQQWFKVRGDYILVNTANHHIIQVVNAR